MKRTIIGLSTLLLFACSKKGSAPLPSVTYDLYNYSSGSPQSAGTFTIQERIDKNATLTIHLSSAYFVPGTNLMSSIVTTDTGSQTLVFANLQPVNGGNGTGVTNPVVSSGTSTPVPYQTLIGLGGYSIQVLSGANIQAKGSIQ